INITQPTFSVHRPEKPNGVAAIILPGGGFGKVVPDLEGTEAADWLNQIGVTAFVLRYRTTDDPLAPGWAKPLQDAQRLLARLRSEAETWKIDPDRLGIVAFSAGGQVGARLLCDQNQLAYKPLDQIDTVAHRPDFAILVYPWRITDDKTQTLISDLKVPTNCPPTCLIHTHDDKSTAVGAALFYAELRRHNIPAELHIYGNGGHGYGLRKIPGSQISSWPDHAGHWLQTLPLWK
ncbi:MAG: alpha/beta hydrolase, partial [Planctomycetaceae bacterium]|nr:alpha/beta hydrolase [Planctomycetaceae bacterium]